MERKLAIISNYHVNQLHSCSVQPLGSGGGSVDGAFVSAFQDLLMGSENEIEMCHCQIVVETCTLAVICSISVAHDVVASKHHFCAVHHLLAAESRKCEPHGPSSLGHCPVHGLFFATASHPCSRSCNGCVTRDGEGTRSLSSWCYNHAAG